MRSSRKVCSDLFGTSSETLCIVIAPRVTLIGFLNSLPPGPPESAPKYSTSLLRGKGGDSGGWMVGGQRIYTHGNINSHFRHCVW